MSPIALLAARVISLIAFSWLYLLYDSLPFGLLALFLGLRLLQDDE